MKKILFTLLLLLAALLQISWASLFQIYGFFFSPVLFLLIFALTQFRVEEVLLFAFGVGILLDLLSTSWLGIQSLSLAVSVVASFWGRNLFLKRVLWSSMVAFLTAFFVYELLQRGLVFL